MKFIIVASKFNEKLMNELIKNTISSLMDSEVKADDIDLIRVPGAYEIPQMINFVHFHFLFISFSFTPFL